ncbi:MAG TPA: hypothetical protein VIJ28_24270 [Chloroflexota bacterium]
MSEDLRVDRVEFTAAVRQDNSLQRDALRQSVPQEKIGARVPPGAEVEDGRGLLDTVHARGHARWWFGRRQCRSCRLFFARRHGAWLTVGKPYAMRFHCNGCVRAAREELLRGVRQERT